MMGEILVRCRVCEELSFDPRLGRCTDEDCGWEGRCTTCGGPLAEPTKNRYCSSTCHGEALDEQHAELLTDDGGL